MAASPPFAVQKRTPTKQVDSTPLIVYGSDNGSFIDGILVCNTNNKEIFVSFHTLDERNLVADTHMVSNNQVLSPYETKELLKGATLFMEPGDLMYGYSSFSGDTFDCHISYRDLTEVVV